MSAVQTAPSLEAFRKLRFRRQFVAAESYEAAAAWDIDGDGVVDILSGRYWYHGPDYRIRHSIGEVANYGGYYDSFSQILLDVDGDGRLDVVDGSWCGAELYWRQCPADPTEEWPKHPIAKTGNIETTRAWDLDGDGVVEIVPNTPGAPLCFYKLVTDARGRGTGRFTRHVVLDRAHGHGLGCGDIDGDGQPELIVKDGWLKAPEGGPCAGPWTHHAEFDLGCASVPIIVADLTGNGLGDLIVGNGHGYGLWWFEQRLEGGTRRWIRHEIDMGVSQYHDMRWADIDGDGLPELVTGKRYHAHCGKDPGAHDPLVIAAFKWTGGGFEKKVISEGDLGAASGCGIFFDLADLRGTGRLDIVAPGKDGLQIFFNEGA